MYNVQWSYLSFIILKNIVFKSYTQMHTKAKLSSIKIYEMKILMS